MAVLQIIVEPAIDFASLYQATTTGLKRNIASVVDRSAKSICNSEKYLLSLAALNEPDCDEISSALFSHLSYGVLIAASPGDSLAVLTCLQGMSYELTVTENNATLGVMTGTLAQWRDAVVCGTNHRGGSTQTAFCNLMRQFETRGLGVVWKDFTKHERGNLFLLEEK